MADKLRYKLDLQMFAGDKVTTLELTINFDENITKVEATNWSGKVFATWNTSGQVVSIDISNVIFNVSLKDGYVLNEITLGNNITNYGGVLDNVTDKSFRVQFGSFTSDGGTITLTSKPVDGGSSMKQATINLSFNSSTGPNTLSSTDTSLVQISADKKSYIVKGTTYTPTVSKSSKVNKLYRLNSWTMPSGSTVGTTSPSSSRSGSPNTTSDYTSSEVNYYTSHTTSPTYDYEYKRISINTSTGAVSGDTSYCTYETDYDTREVETTTTRYSLKTITWVSKGYWKVVGSTGSLLNSLRKSYTRGTLSATQQYEHSQTGGGMSIVIRIDPDTGEITNSLYCSSFTTYTDTSTSTTTEKYNYHFTKVIWDFSITVNGYSYAYSSGDLTSGTATSRTGTFRRKVSSGSTYYDPDFYSKFTFDASTGNITWSHRNGSTSYYNKVEDNSTFDIDDVSTTTYTHNSTDWNYDGEILSQSKTALTIEVSTISWSFTNKTGTNSTGGKIRFISKDNVVTWIEKL